MHDFHYYDNTGSHPFTGIVKTDFKATLSKKPFLNGFFNGTPNYSQVKNVTRGKEYTIHKVEGFGDMAEFSFLDDTGTEQTLGNFFFEAPEMNSQEKSHP